MSSFAADWLALREPYDARARNRSVLDAVDAFFANEQSIAIVDLACGTGSTLRAVSPLLPARQSWRLVDNDLGLLARAQQNDRPPATMVATVPIDLARDLEAALDGQVDLITISAFLDLVSGEWLERLAVEAAARGLPVYAALTYAGGVAIEPADPLDAAMIQAVDRHQRSDKGFGPALGPSAAPVAIGRFEGVGYTVVHGPSDWTLAPDDDIQAELVSGWASAAREIADLPLGEIIGWLTRRKDLITAGRSSICVAHVDFFARPMGNRRRDRSQSNSTSFSSG